MRNNPNHAPAGSATGGQFAPGGGGGSSGGAHGETAAAAASRLGQLKQVGAWLKSTSAIEVMSAVANDERTKAGLSFALQSLVSHGTVALSHLTGGAVPEVQGLDPSTWGLNEEVIGHSIEHFATIAAISKLQAKEAMQTAVTKLIAIRKKVTGRAAEDDDEVIAFLEFLSEQLDKFDPGEEPAKPADKGGAKPTQTKAVQAIRRSAPLRTEAAPGGGLEFVLSDGSRDRHGTRINPNGWDLRSFNLNPIALFTHTSSFPIGRWENVRVVAGKLIGKLVFAAHGTSARIDELRKLVEQGILRAVSVGFEVIEEGDPTKGFDFNKQELLEVSLVSVGSNKNALAMARSLRISDETMSLAFGEHAVTWRRDVTAIGEHAATTTSKEARAKLGLRPIGALGKGSAKMKTLAQRIEDAQNELNVKRDRLVEISGADDLDIDAIEELNGQIEVKGREIAVLKASETRLAGMTVSSVASALAPGVSRRPLGIAQREVRGLDLLVRAITARGISHFSNRSLDQVLEERYPGHEATAIVTRADQTVGTTTVSGWASELVQQSWADFLQALTGYSVYPALRSRGIGLSFDGVGTVNIPSRTAGGAGGGFVAEGSPIRVGRVTTASTTITPKKLGVIVPFTRELAKRSTPAIEALVRQAILEDTASILDSAILDATASSTARPAGLLNGVSAIASGYGGGDFAAIVADFKALLAPFYAADAADNITVIMNPAQGLSMALTPDAMGQFGWSDAITKRLNVIESTHATANRLIAIRNSDFATALGDAPEFDISEQATVHMEDTTPLEIVSGTGPTTADPVRSFFQTATIGVRMLMDVSWKMRRSGMVAWIDTTTW